MNAMRHQTELVIIGAGAAGLAAGIFAAQTQPGIDLVILDGAKKVGSKILVSGGGRCNVTNSQLHASDFHGPARIISKILQRFDQQATIRWFESLHIPLKQEALGKLFPVSNSSKTVLHGLLNRCRELSIPLLEHHRVSQVQQMDDGFMIQHSHGTLSTRQLILATGGQSLPKTGSDGQGLSFARQLGHHVGSTYPALVPLILDEAFFHRELSGISHEVELTTRIGGKIADRRTGSLLWTHFGVSGPVVLDASRCWVVAQGQGQSPKISIDFFPQQSFSVIDQWLTDAGNQPGRQTVSGLLGTRLPTRLATTLCTYLNERLPNICPAPTSPKTSSHLGSSPVNSLSRPQRRSLTEALSNLPLPVIQSRGWNFAEVTAGGVPLREIHPHTMGSRKAPGLYLIGELLDCDGRIGGFNFQWAWATGYLAGISAAEASQKPVA